MNSFVSFSSTPLYTLTLSILSGLGLAGIVWWRAGSLHCLLDRIWRLAAGKRTASDQTVDEFVEMNRQLEYFRFVYRLNARTPRDMHKVIDLCKEKDIGITSLQLARWWVDLSSDSILRYPSKVRGWTVTGALLFPLILLAHTLVTSWIGIDQGVLQFKESKTWFKTDGQHISRVFSRGPSLDFTTCQQGELTTQVNWLTKNEITLLCQGAKNGDLKKSADAAIKDQRELAFVIFLMFLLSTGVMALYLRAREEAVMLCKKAGITQQSVT